MEGNPEYKSGMESPRRLDVSDGFLPATSAFNVIPNIVPCIPLDPVSETESAVHGLHIPLPRLAGYGL